MLNGLIKTPDDVPSLIPTQEETQAANTSSNFIQSLKLIQGSAKEVGTEDTQGQKISQGDFFIQSQNITVGDQLEIVVVLRRAHALLIVNNQKTLETFDINSPIWKEIKQTKDNYDEGIVKFVGEGDWLLYLPQYTQFVTFFCGRAATHPLTVMLKKFMTKPDERRNEVDHDLPWTNHFMMRSQVKTWGPKLKAMSPTIEPMALYDLKSNVKKDDAQWASDTFYAPLKQEQQVEEATEKDDR